MSTLNGGDFATVPSALTEVELLIRIGEYQRGVDTDTDKAIDTYPDI